MLYISTFMDTWIIKWIVATFNFTIGPIWPCKELGEGGIYFCLHGIWEGRPRISRFSSSPPPSGDRKIDGARMGGRMGKARSRDLRKSRNVLDTFPPSFARIPSVFRWRHVESTSSRKLRVPGSGSCWPNTAASDHNRKIHRGST